MSASYARKSVDLVDETVRALELRIQEEKVKKREKRTTSKNKLAELKKALCDETSEGVPSNVQR